jgi:ABC-type phosphate transport system substrate-binding protein
MHTLRQTILLLLGLLGGGQALGEVVVVVDAQAGVERLTPDEVVNIFLGRYRMLPGGREAHPIDQPADSRLRAEFYRLLVGKDLAEINAYWARLHFSGKTAPPLQAASSVAVIAHVLGKPGGVGYIDREQADSRVRIVLTLSP